MKDYILLPRSELNSASKLPYDRVTQLHRRVDGITGEIFELHLQQTGDNLSAFFSFSLDLQPKSIVYVWRQLPADSWAGRIGRMGKA